MAAVGLDVTFRPLEDDDEPSLAFDGLKEMSVQTNTSSHIHCWCDGVETDILLSQLVAFRYKALLGSCWLSELLKIPLLTGLSNRLCVACVVRSTITTWHNMGRSWRDELRRLVGKGNRRRKLELTHTGTSAVERSLPCHSLGSYHICVHSFLFILVSICGLQAVTVHAVHLTMGLEDAPPDG